MFKRVCIFGTWDLFHVGHLRAIKKAAGFGEYVVVGVESDELVMLSKGHVPYINECQRKEIIESLGCVSEAFIYHNHNYFDCIIDKCADVVIWNKQNKEPRHLEFLQKLKTNKITIKYIKPMPGISTTIIAARIICANSDFTNGGKQ